MVIRSGSGYGVRSESGKSLGGGYATKDEAEKRLRQVEYFKHRDMLSDESAKRKKRLIELRERYHELG